jgi:FeS assembly SUF system protein
MESPLDRDREFSPLERQIVEVLKGVFDPEIPVSVWDLGLIYMIDVGPLDHVHIKMTLTAPSCPAAQILPGQIEDAVRSIPDVKEAEVQVVWEPPYHPDFMTEEAKLELGFM